MSKPDPRNLAPSPEVGEAFVSHSDDVDSHEHNDEEARWLLRLASASTLAILALAAASIVVT